MMKKTIIFLFVLFFVNNIIVYYITKLNSEHIVNIVLKENLDTLALHYKILLESQKTTASTAYQSTIQLKRVIEIMSEAQSATQEQKVVLRQELHELLKNKYHILKQKGVLQYQFVFPNNISFYRAHKPSKFGDDLTDIRSDFKYTNINKKPIRAFVHGRVAHGFRNTFPLFDKDSNHIGAMEISFSSDSFQEYLNHISEIHTHFLVNKDIFNTKTWKSNDVLPEYKESAESSKYMVALHNHHSEKEGIAKKKVKLKHIQKEIDMKIALGKPFSTYARHFKHIDIISFLPIKTAEGETAAWLVSYGESKTIGITLLNTMIFRIIAFLILLAIVYFLAKQIHAKQKIEKQAVDIQEQHRLLNSILNLTDNIMFITDFKNIKFSNNKFKDLLSEKHIKQFENNTNHNMLNLFINTDGYLHEGLLQEDEIFVSLILRSDALDRIVSIVDRNSEPKAFTINVTKSENKDDYLVTLSDITEIKEFQVQTEKKAYIDTLTNVYNRNKFDEILESEIKNRRRGESVFSIAIIDIDKFKNVNDSYGHLVGDEVLTTMAQTVNSNLRSTDTFARWGGEEFIILFKNTSLEIAKIVSEKLKDKIEENTHVLAGKITASFGVTQFIEGDTQESIFQRCDEALYLAKENGRNRVESL